MRRKTHFLAALLCGAVFLFCLLGSGCQKNVPQAQLTQPGGVTQSKALPSKELYSAASSGFPFTTQISLLQNSTLPGFGATQKITAGQNTQAASTQTQSAAPASTSPPPPATGTAASQPQTQSAFAQEVLRLCNEERGKQGMFALLYGNDKLQSCADIRAKEANGSFSHTRPNGSTFYFVFSEKGLAYRYCGENLAQYGSKAFTPQSLVNGWMNSPAHRENILNANYQYMALGNTGNSYAQLFFTP